MDWPSLLQTIVTWATDTGIRIVTALLILLLGFRTVTVVTRRIEKKLNAGKRSIDKTVSTTLFYAIRIVLKGLIVVCLIGYLGIDTGGITALIASLGVGIGLAVNGALSNLAGGVLLLITRPFRIDDYIEAQGFAGTVEDIHVTFTRLRTPDNKVIYVPNGALSTGTIVNYSEKRLRRVDHTFTVGYADDVEQAKSVIAQLVSQHGKVLEDPPPFVRVSEHGEEGVRIVVRVWVASADYWDVYHDLLEQVKAALDEEGIKKPFQQIDVHIQSSDQQS